MHRYILVEAGIGISHSHARNQKKIFWESRNVMCGPRNVVLIVVKAGYRVKKCMATLILYLRSKWHACIAVVSRFV